MDAPGVSGCEGPQTNMMEELLYTQAIWPTTFFLRFNVILEM